MSVAQPTSNSPPQAVQDTGAMAKEKDRHERSDTADLAPRPVSDSANPKNIIPEVPHDNEAENVSLVIPAGSASTSLTSIPPHLVFEAPNVSPSSRPRSRPASRDTSPYPRSRPSTPNRPSTPSAIVASSSVRSVPPRRSARTSAKGPERPRGPPELEAALTIAIRNLESDIYEWWCANQKPGSPIPTTAYLKGRSPRIRRAAEAVDEADRLLNEAIYGKTKRGPGRPPKKPQAKSVANAPSGDVPEAAFGQLELNSQVNSPLPRLEEAENRPSEEEGRTKTSFSDAGTRKEQ